MSVTIARRKFVAGLASAAAWPVVGRAQQPAMPVVGFLSRGTPDGYAKNVAAFHQGLKELGYIVGENVAIEYRWTRGDFDRLPALAAELISRKVSVIVGNTYSASVAKGMTATIPIVFVGAIDPVEIGLVASLNRPGGNVTGLTTLAAEIGSKRMQLLHELLPTAKITAALVNPKRPDAENQSKDLKTAAINLGLQLYVLHASSEEDFEPAFQTAVQLRSAGLVIGADTLFNASVERLAALAARYAMPAIFQYREFAAAGALMSYGDSITDQYRLLGTYTGRILKGEKPADLPVQRATKLDLIINMKTAKALGLMVPPMLAALATEIIE
jgi:putative tryptophan/tyrosine transport system substrate-binding protein